MNVSKLFFFAILSSALSLINAETYYTDKNGKPVKTATEEELAADEMRAPVIKMVDLDSYHKRQMEEAETPEAVDRCVRAMEKVPVTAGTKSYIRERAEQKKRYMGAGY